MSTEKRKVWRVLDAQGNTIQVLYETSADQVTVADTGGKFTGTNVETVLAELADAIAGAGSVNDVQNQNGTSLVSNKIATVTPANIGAIPTTQKGTASGVATLDTNSKIPTSQLPDVVLGQLVYGGGVEQSSSVNNFAVGDVFNNIYFDTTKQFTPGDFTFAEGEIYTTLISTDMGNIQAQKSGDNLYIVLGSLTFYDSRNGGSYPLATTYGNPLPLSTLLGADITITGLSQQSVWGVAINKGSGSTNITATLTTNAKTKLGTSANTINLTNDTTAITGYTANEGIYYVATGSFTFAEKSITTGDWLISLGTRWDKVDNTDAVSSVNGKTGAVVLDKSDIGLGNVNNTSDAQKTVLSASHITLSKQFAITGDATGSVYSDLSDGVSIPLTLANTGVTAGSYSAVVVDAKGRVTAGGKSIEFGTSGQTAPSDDLMIGGIFFELQ